MFKEAMRRFRNTEHKVATDKSPQRLDEMGEVRTPTSRGDNTLSVNSMNRRRRRRQQST